MYSYIYIYFIYVLIYLYIDIKHKSNTWCKLQELLNILLKWALTSCKWGYNSTYRGLLHQFPIDKSVYKGPITPFMPSRGPSCSVRVLVENQTHHQKHPLILAILRAGDLFLGGSIVYLQKGSQITIPKRSLWIAWYLHVGWIGALFM